MFIYGFSGNFLRNPAFFIWGRGAFKSHALIDFIDQGFAEYGQLDGVNFALCE